MVKKKVELKSLAEKRAMVHRESKLSIRQQCILLSLCRSGIYYTPSPETALNLEIMRHMDEQYLKTPFYGLPRVHQFLKDPALPYLLRGLPIERPNQVWAIDITYIPIKRGFMYLMAIIDIHTRFVLHWSISNTMTALWIREGVSEAIAGYGYPEIINSDQGSQFTSDEYTSLFTPEHIPTRISMDGKGRCIDNIFIKRLWRSVKYECVYLHTFEDGVV